MAASSSPRTPFSLHGGCNCRAIRYTLNIPAVSERPVLSHAHESNGQGDIHYPLVCLDHCNDCRRATGSCVMIWIIVPRNLATMSFLKKSTAKPWDGRRVEVQDEERIEIPGSVACLRNDETADTFMSYFNSSPERVRTFCSRCGTNISYACHPMPADLLPTVDILLGTVDREDMEKYSIQPDRHLWWNYGVDWIRRLVSDGDKSLSGSEEGLKRHPIYKVEEFAS